MAAFRLAAAFSLALIGARSDVRAADEAVVNKVTLSLLVSGLSQDGCEIEIKPGHAACDFKPIVKKLPRHGREEIRDIVVKSSSADHDCLFAITVKEQGQPPRTIRRGLVLQPQTDKSKTPSQTLTCLLRSPSLTAKGEAEKSIR
jgi:hypothetical protein